MYKVEIMFATASLGGKGQEEGGGLGGDLGVGGAHEGGGLGGGLGFLAEHKEGFGAVELGGEMGGLELEGAVEGFKGKEGGAELEVEAAKGLEIVRGRLSENRDALKKGEGDLVGALLDVGIPSGAEIVNFAAAPTQYFNPLFRTHRLASLILVAAGDGEQ